MSIAGVNLSSLSFRFKAPDQSISMNSLHATENIVAMQIIHVVIICARHWVRVAALLKVVDGHMN